MYRNVQEPMMDAAQPQETPTQRNSSGQSGATGAAMPNPWGTTTALSNPTSTNPAAPNPFGRSSMTAPLPNPWGNNTMTTTGTAAGANPFGGGAPPNPQQLEQTLQMLENPMVAQMMDQMLQQNPEMITQMMAQNPMMQQMQRENPAMAQMMASPEFVRQMMNPATLRTMMQLQQSMGGSMPPMGGMGGSMPPMGGSMPPMGGMGGSMPPPMDFSNLLNQFQSTGLHSQQPQQAPADRFRVQLQSLRDMGFDDEMANVSALQQNHGNLNRAVDYLLMNPTSVSSTAPAPVPTSSAPAMSSDPPAPSDGGDAATADETPPSQDNNAASEEPKGNAEKKND
jgi:ubiquilin